MKKIVTALIIFFCTTAFAGAENLDETKIYHFYQPGCPHCHEAIGYINQKYPELKMEMINITANRENFNLFLRCAKKFNLGRELGTPLMCMGNRYIMGWSPQQQQQFDEYVRPFSKSNKITTE